MACRQPRCIPRYVDRSGSFLVGTATRNVPSKSRREQVRADRRLFRNRAGHQRGRLRHALGERSDCGFSQAPRTPDAASISLRKRGAARSCTIDEGICGLARLGRGLWRVRPGPSRQPPAIEKTTALTGFTVTSLFEDREGNLWAGTADGLNRLTPYKVTPLTNLGLVRGVESAPDGSVWVGTFDALFRFRDGDVSLRDGPEVLSAPLSAMHADNRGTFWVATERSLFRFDDRALLACAASRRAPGAEDSLHIIRFPGRTVDSRSRTGCVAVERRAVGAPAPAAPPAGCRNHRHLCRPKRPDLACVCERLDWRGRSRRPGRVLRAARRLLRPVFTGPIYQDKLGVIWLGGVEGLTRFADGRFATLHPENGFPAGSVTANRRGRRGMSVAGDPGCRDCADSTNRAGVRRLPARLIGPASVCTMRSMASRGRRGGSSIAAPCAQRMAGCGSWAAAV